MASPILVASCAASPWSARSSRTRHLRTSSHWTSTAPLLRSASPRALLATASVAVALASADTYVVVLALPDMMAGVGLGSDELQRATPIISGFLLGYIAVLPLIGRLSDLVSRQRILLVCLSLFVVGSAVTAVSVELPVLVGGRVLQGIGGGGLVTATLALVADLWPPERRGTPLGVVGAVQELGSVLGPLLGAAVLAVADWRAIFWLIDLLGAFCIAVALGSLVLTFASADPEHEVVGPWGWTLVPLGLVAVAAYLWRHRTARDPLVPRGLMSTGSTSAHGA